MTADLIADPKEVLEMSMVCTGIKPLSVSRFWSAASLNPISWLPAPSDYTSLNKLWHLTWLSKKLPEKSHNSFNILPSSLKVSTPLFRTQGSVSAVCQNTSGCVNEAGPDPSKLLYTNISSDRSTRNPKIDILSLVWTKHMWVCEYKAEKLILSLWWQPNYWDCRLVSCE